MSIDFQQYLSNNTHDWISLPKSMHGWRINGGRGSKPVSHVQRDHAGLDYQGFHTIYLAPLLAFEINSKRPSLVRTCWTPASVTAIYQVDSFELTMLVALPQPDQALVAVTIVNRSETPQTCQLTMYGQQTRRIDASSAVDIHVTEGGHEKTFLELAHQRLGHNCILSETIGDIADSHRGGLTRYDLFRVCRWHHMRVTNAIALTLPNGGKADDASDHWRQHWELAIEPNKTISMNIGLAAKYQARQRVDQPTIQSLSATATQTASLNIADVIAQRAAYWQQLLEQVRPPHEALEDHIKQMYYRAWVCTWQLVTPGFDTGRIDGLQFEKASMLVTKADHSATMPAEWETALGALLINQQDPQLAADILDSVFAAIEPDGYVPECLVVTKENMLTFVTSYVAWQIFQNTGDVAWLAKHYEAQKRSFWAHYRSPNFKRRGNPTFRNLVYIHIGAIYMAKIAQVISLPAHEVEYANWLVDETQQIVQNFWDPERNHFADHYNDRASDPGGIGFVDFSSVQSMVALFEGATDEQKKHLVADLKNKYLIGEYGIRESGKQGGGAPNAVADDETDLSKINTYKHANFMYFIPGLAQANPDVCREICLRTVNGIAHNGDFFEQMSCDMGGRAFGPMAVFGAYAYIQCAQTLGQLGVD